jgi:hypothetical protein
MSMTVVRSRLPPFAKNATSVGIGLRGLVSLELQRFGGPPGSDTQRSTGSATSGDRPDMRDTTNADPIVRGTATPPCGAERVARAAPSTCYCGKALPTPRPTGRPRLTCSSACRRRRDHWLRRLHRREHWISLWEAEEGRRSYPRARLRAELRELRAERHALLLALGGADREPASTRPSAPGDRVHATGADLDFDLDRTSSVIAVALPPPQEPDGATGAGAACHGGHERRIASSN